MKNRIKELRMRKNLSISDLAKLVEVDEEILFYYENDELTVNLEDVIRIADYFKITLDYLFMREARKPEVEEIYLLKDKETGEFGDNRFETYEEALMELSKRENAEITIVCGRWWPEIEATSLMDKFDIEANDECGDELGDYFLDTPDEVVNELENELNSVLTFWMLRHYIDPEILECMPISEDLEGGV